MKIDQRVKIEKYCPACGSGTKLVVRTNRKSDSQFLGCENFPICTHTEKIPESMYMEAAGQKRLL